MKTFRLNTVTKITLITIITFFFYDQLTSLKRYLQVALKTSRWNSSSKQNSRFFAFPKDKRSGFLRDSRPEPL